HFGPMRLSAAVVGDVSIGRVVDHAKRVFGGWRASPGAPPLPPAAAAAVRRQFVVVPMMNKAQADIAYGFIAIRRADPMYYAFTLMNNALGEYAIGGRLGDRIREREGMAYYVHSSLDATVAEGPLVVRVGVGPA